MRFFYLLLGLLCSFSRASMASGVYFTTVFLDDEGVVYVGLKHGDGAGESQVLSFPFASGERTNYPLPDEIVHRDVIGLLPEHQKLFVLTISASAKNEGTMLHIFDRKKNSWKKVGQVVCPDILSVNLQRTRMVFHCAVGKTKRGHSATVSRTLSFGKERLYHSGSWRFPEFLRRYKGRTALLEGRAPSWDKLRLRSEDDDRIISAEELFQIPLPLEAPEAAPVSSPAQTPIAPDTKAPSPPAVTEPPPPRENQKP